MLTLTALDTLRAQGKLDAYINRDTPYGLLFKGLENAKSPTGIITPDVLAKSAESWGRVFEIAVLAQAQQANGTGIVCNITGIENVSDLYAVTYATISGKFQMEPAKHVTNQIGYFQDYALKYKRVIKGLGLAMDAAIDSALNATLTPAAQYASTLVGAGNSYPFVANALQVSAALRGIFFNQLSDILFADDLLPEFDVISTAAARGYINQLYAQGAANAANTAYQFSDFSFGYSNRVTTSAGAMASGFVLPKGSFAVLTQNGNDYLANAVAGDGKMFGTYFEPSLGIRLDTLFSSACANISALTNNVKDTAGVQESHQFQSSFAVVVPYQNFAVTGRSGVIRKYDLLAV